MIGIGWVVAIGFAAFTFGFGVGLATALRAKSDLPDDPDQVDEEKWLLDLLSERQEYRRRLNIIAGMETPSASYTVRKMARIARGDVPETTQLDGVGAA